jgi:hypothetical protein
MPEDGLFRDQEAPSSPSVKLSLPSSFFPAHDPFIPAAAASAREHDKDNHQHHEDDRRNHDPDGGMEHVLGRGKPQQDGLGRVM